MPNSRIKGRGADCIGFVSAVVDELYRKTFKVGVTPAVGFSHDSQDFVKFYCKCHMLWPVERAQSVDVGDIVLDRPKSGHAHIYITGSSPYTFWHSLHNRDVRCSGLDCLGKNLTFFRLLHKERWI